MKRQLTLLLTLLCSVAMGQGTIMNIYQSNGTVLQIPLSSIDSITYTIGSPGTLASISTLPVGSITANSAGSGGIVSSSGGTNVTQRGVCWSTSPNPTTANSITSDGSGSGTFNSTLLGLTANTTYYVRAYAINSAGTAYGNQLQFTTTSNGGGNIVSNPGPGVTFDGYNYSTIILGNGQEWMSENLRTTTYANGDPIPNVTNGLQWYGLTTGAWCYFDNNSQYENPYGKLYNGYTVEDSRNVCPNGWHIPDSTDWNLLVKYLDSAADTNCFLCVQSGLAGGMMKGTGTQYWRSPNNGATNQSGFLGLPAGERDMYGSFNATDGDICIWWGIGLVPFNQLTWYLNPYNGNVYKGGEGLNKGLSIRCLRD